MDDERRNKPQRKPLAAAGAADVRDSVRCRKEREEAEEELSLLPFPRELMSVVLLCSDGGTLAQAACVSKVSCTEP